MAGLACKAEGAVGVTRGDPSAADCSCERGTDADLRLSRALGKQHFNLERIEELHRAVEVGGRYLALPLERVPAARAASPKRNDAFIRVALELGEQAVRAALEAAGIAPPRRRPPLLRHRHRHRHALAGRAAGQPARPAARRQAHAHLRPGLRGRRGRASPGPPTTCARFPDQVAVLLSVELCSLTLQRGDVSVANIIASGLFGDGAAAVVLAGGEPAASRAAPRMRGHAHRLLPGHRAGHGLGHGRQRLQGGALGAKVPSW